MARHSPIPIYPGCRFGRLTVIEQAESTPAGKFRWKCLCDCSKVSYPSASDLRQGHTKSCGCLQKELTSKDITDKRFGRLVALYQTGERGRGGSIVWCVRCDCGRKFEATTSYLGLIKSCGCLQRETASQLLYRHGSSRESIYKIWTSMKSRCFNPKNSAYKNYGGRGITVAAEWIDDFPAFKKYIDQYLGPRPKGYTLDRIENRENYEFGNLRWASRIVQNNNSRHTLVDKAVNTILQECANKPARASARHVART